MSRHIRRVAIVAVVGDDKLYTYNSSSGTGLFRALLV